MFGNEKMATSNRTYPDEISFKIFMEFPSAAQRIRKWIKQHLYIDWHPPATSLPNPDAQADDYAFSTLTFITFNRFCRVHIYYLKDEYHKRRARSNSIWESEIVRDILRAFDLMSNEDRIQKFLRYSRWEPWIFAADSLVFNWKERFRMNRERTIQLNNKFKSFCDMLRMED